MDKKNLTLRYSLTQFTFWAASTGATSFATTYLLNCGISSGIVGTLLAVAGLLSCLTQPIMAGIADKAKRFVLIKLLLGMSFLCVLCFGVQLLPHVPIVIEGISYMIGIWSSDAMVPLTNALCISYTQAGFTINYGAARGVGSAASAISSLVLGFVIAQLGSTWMILLLVSFRVLCILILWRYPKIEKINASENRADDSCSVWQFFARYRWYCASLTGVLFLGMYHAMTENYLIAIMGRLGGNSTHVGTALFISSMVGAFVIFFFNQVRKVIPDTRLLKIAGCSFLLKAILFYFAQNINTIYLLQLIQITSYAFLAPTQVYYAKAKVQPADMVKGQAFSTAAYALGCSAGNFTGGQLLGLGVDVILIAGIIMTLIGTIIIFITVTKSDCRNEVSQYESN